MKRLVALAPIVILLIVAASAWGFWQYRGDVSDAKHSTIQLVVHHSRSGEPRSVQLGMSGRLKLRCANGSTTRAHVRTATVPAHIGHHGRFRNLDLRGNIRVTGPGGVIFRVTIAELDGRVGRHHASGRLRVAAISTNRRKGCDSGPLRWHAHFVPRR